MSYIESRPHYRRRQGLSANALVARVWNILTLIKVWRMRARYRRELAARSEHELQDMGTCWSSIADEISKPFWRA